eukprot:3137955-Ditylum_brightwellii.AAC.1
MVAALPPDTLTLATQHVISICFYRWYSEDQQLLLAHTLVPPDANTTASQRSYTPSCFRLTRQDIPRLDL